jgi:hypothetical protein
LRISFWNSANDAEDTTMTQPLSPETAAALLAAQGRSSTPEGAQAYAGFVTQQLAAAAGEFARLDFEEEPAGYTAALRRNAR